MRATIRYAPKYDAEVSKPADQIDQTLCKYRAAKYKAISHVDQQLAGSGPKLTNLSRTEHRVSFPPIA
jgi:hypothetical protein